MPFLVDGRYEKSWQDVTEALRGKLTSLDRPFGAWTDEVQHLFEDLTELGPEFSVVGFGSQDGGFWLDGELFGDHKDRVWLAWKRTRQICYTCGQTKDWRQNNCGDCDATTPAWTMGGM